MAAESEIYDLGQVWALRRLLDLHGLPWGAKVHVDLVIAVPAGMPGTTDAVVAAVASLPAQTNSWSPTGIGRSTLLAGLTSLSKDGHLRVGMEDVLTTCRGTPVDSNAHLVPRLSRWAGWRNDHRYDAGSGEGAAGDCLDRVVEGVWRGARVSSNSVDPARTTTKPWRPGTLAGDRDKQALVGGNVRLGGNFGRPFASPTEIAPQ